MRTRVIFPVMPQCGHFIDAQGDQVSGCGPRPAHQCAVVATVAILDDEDHVCGEFCVEHAESVYQQLSDAEPDKWFRAIIVRGNPRTGVVRPEDMPS